MKLADVCTGILAYGWSEPEIERDPKTSHVERWYAEIIARPGFPAAHDDLSLLIRFLLRKRQYASSLSDGSNVHPTSLQPFCIRKHPIRTHFGNRHRDCELFTSWERYVLGALAPILVARMAYVAADRYPCGARHPQPFPSTDARMSTG